jgi:hypothetical protein
VIDGKFVETDEGKKELTLGSKSLSHIEVLKGLNEGQVIYKPE